MISIVVSSVLFFAIGGFLGRWSRSNSSTAKAAVAGANQVVAEVKAVVNEVKNV